MFIQRRRHDSVYERLLEALVCLATSLAFAMLHHRSEAEDAFQ